MASNPNLILTIKAADPFSAEAIFFPHNKHRRVGEEDSTGSETGSSRGSTPELQESVPEPTRLELRFDKPPKNPAEGFVFGSDPDICDVLVGSRARGISGRHFSINFDEKSRLVLRCISRHGVSVSYDGCAGKQRRREGFQWTLFPSCKIKIHIRDCKRDAYILEQPDLAGHEADREKRLEAYVLQHPQSKNTVTNTQAPVYVERECLGSGSFGTVYKTLNASTGGTVALKRFKPGTECVNEVNIMKSVSHKYIVKYIDFVDDGPKPGLAMEYLPLGSLEKHEISADTARTLFLQMIEALDYLHQSGITHRDIKPANILIQSRGSSSDFHAKLSDFGFAKSSEVLQSICGSDLFLAPEIWEAAMLCRDDVRYTNAVDIWSLGVVMLDLLQGLPRSHHQKCLAGKQRRERKAKDGLDWCEQIAESTAELALSNEDDCLYTILTNMLVVKDSERLGASECLQFYLQNASAEDLISPAISKTNTLAEFKTVSRSSTDVSRIASELHKQLDEQGLIDPDLNYSELLRPRPSSSKDAMSLDQILEHREHSLPSESRKRKRSPEPDSPRKFRPDVGWRDIRHWLPKFVIKPDPAHLDPEEAEQSIEVILSQLVVDLEAGFHSSVGVSPPSADADSHCSLLPLIPHVQRLGVSLFHTSRHIGWIEVYSYSRVYERFVEIFHLRTSEAKSRAELVHTLLCGLQRHSKYQDGGDYGLKRRRRGSNEAEDGGAKGIRATSGKKMRPSTRSFTESEIRQCTIKGQIIHYRLCDDMICLDDLADAARRSASWRTRELSKLPAESKELSNYGTLVPFSIALPIIRRLGLKVPVCRKTGMNETPAPTEYRGQVYTHVTVRGKNVCLREADGRVNAAHLIRAAGKNRTARNKVLEVCGISSMDVEQVAAHPTAQGAYVCYADGRRLCEYLGLEVPDVMREGGKGPSSLNIEGAGEATICYKPEHQSRPQEQDSSPHSLTPTPPPQPRDPDMMSRMSEVDDKSERKTSHRRDHSASRVSHWESTKSHLSAVQPHYSIDSIGSPGGWPSGESLSSFSLFGLSRPEDGLVFGQGGR